MLKMFQFSFELYIYCVWIIQYITPDLEIKTILNTQKMKRKKERKHTKAFLCLNITLKQFKLSEFQWLAHTHIARKEKIEGKSRKRQKRMRWLNSITDSVDMNSSKLREIVQDREAWRAAVHKVTNIQTPLGLNNNRKKLFYRLSSHS